MPTGESTGSGKERPDAFSFYEKQERPTRKDLLSKVLSQLVYARRSLGLTQETVNGRIGVADRLINKWECGDKSPTAFNLMCWADVLKGQMVFVPDELAEDMKTRVRSHYELLRDKK